MGLDEVLAVYTAYGLHVLSRGSRRPRISGGLADHFNAPCRGGLIPGQAAPLGYPAGCCAPWP